MVDEARLSGLIDFSVDRSRGQRKILGFLPRGAFEDASRRNRMSWLVSNDQLAAYAVFGPSGASGRIYQIWVEPGVREIEYGRKLVDHIETRVAGWSKIALALWCATDLPANLFWRALGFIPTAQREGGNRGRRLHLEWTRPINRSFANRLRASSRSPREPSPATVQTSLWPTSLEDQTTDQRPTPIPATLEELARACRSLPLVKRRARLLTSASTLARLDR